MFDLFGSDQCDGIDRMKKLKGDSISSKKEQRRLMRDTNCYESLKSFPENGEMCSFVSKGLSDAGSFLFAFYKCEGAIDEAIVVTWTISKSNIIKLLDYVDEGKIKKLTVLINDGLLKTNSTKPIYAFMRLEFDKRKDKISYAVANSHAKIQMYKSESGKFTTVSGSGNWSGNPRIENYVIIGGESVFDYNKKWVEEIVNG